MYRVIIEVKPFPFAACARLRIMGYYTEKKDSQKSVRDMREQCLGAIKKSFIRHDPNADQWGFAVIEFKKVKMNFIMSESQFDKLEE